MRLRNILEIPMLSEVNKVNKDNPIFVSFLLYLVLTPTPTRLFWPPGLLIFQNSWSPPFILTPPSIMNPRVYNFTHDTAKCTKESTPIWQIWRNEYGSHEAFYTVSDHVTGISRNLNWEIITKGVIHFMSLSNFYPCVVLWRINTVIIYPLSPAQLHLPRNSRTARTHAWA